MALCPPNTQQTPERKKPNTTKKTSPFFPSKLELKSELELNSELKSELKSENQNQKIRIRR
jgi:hypothetical protein